MKQDRLPIYSTSGYLRQLYNSYILFVYTIMAENASHTLSILTQLSIITAKVQPDKSRTRSIFAVTTVKWTLSAQKKPYYVMPCTRNGRTLCIVCTAKKVTGNNFPPPTRLGTHISKDATIY